MILKCIGGPQDGAEYFFSDSGHVRSFDPSERPARKPDGLWFSGKDIHGRNVQQQYVRDVNELRGNHDVLVYRYDGDVIDTGIDFETGDA